MSEWSRASSVTDAFANELQALEVGELSVPELLPTRLMLAWERVLPVDGAGVSVLSRMRVPLGASNEHSATAERLQSTLGEGPCLEAYDQSSALIADERDMAARWPIFHAQLVEGTPFRAVASVPLNSGAQRLGAVDLYWRASRVTHKRDLLAAATELAVSVSTQLLAQPAERADLSGALVQPWVQAPAARRRMQVWVAIGMLITPGQLNSADALAVLRASAYARNTTIDELADQLVEGHVEAHQLTG